MIKRRHSPADARSVRAVIRMEAISVSPDAGPDSASFDVEGCIYLGEKWEYRLKRGDLRQRAQGHEPLGAAVAHCRIPAAATFRPAARDSSSRCSSGSGSSAVCRSWVLATSSFCANCSA